MKFSWVVRNFSCPFAHANDEAAVNQKNTTNPEMTKSTLFNIGTSSFVRIVGSKNHFQTMYKISTNV